MKVAVLVEDEVKYHQPLIDICTQNGYRVALVITPRHDTPVEDVVARIAELNPDLIMLDHDFCTCGLLHGRCDCLNGQDVFDRLDALQERVMSISGKNREYVADGRNFCHKDCLDVPDVRRNFGIQLRRVHEPGYIPLESTV